MRKRLDFDEVLDNRGLSEKDKEVIRQNAHNLTSNGCPASSAILQAIQEHDQNSRAGVRRHGSKARPQ